MSFIILVKKPEYRVFQNKRNPLSFKKIQKKSLAQEVRQKSDISKHRSKG